MDNKITDDLLLRVLYLLHKSRDLEYVGSHREIHQLDAQFNKQLINPASCFSETELQVLTIPKRLFQHYILKHLISL